MATLLADSDGDHNNSYDRASSSSSSSSNSSSSNNHAGLVYEAVPGTLLHLLNNSLVLAHTTPYLSPEAVLTLAAAGKPYRALLYGTPSVFRYLDLSRLKAVTQLDRGNGAAGIAPIDRGGESWRNEQLDENLTEDEFYAGPLRGVFAALRRPRLHQHPATNWLAGVHTLVLNNVSVTAELVHEILRSPDYNVRILSLRNAKHCNESQLRHILRMACRASRPDGTPKLRGLYIFGGVGASGEPDGDDLWYRSRGRVLSRAAAAAEWAGTLLDCRGVLAFDGVLCAGPRHANSPAFGKVPGLLTSTAAARRPLQASPIPHATFSVAHLALDGCAGCGSAPEGWTTWGDDEGGQHGHAKWPGADDGGYLARYPLLWPPPLLSSNVRVAMCPEGESVRPNRFGGGHAGNAAAKAPSRFIARCESCVHARLCAVCNRWWCEACLPDTESTVPWEVPVLGEGSSASLPFSAKVRVDVCPSCER